MESKHPFKLAFKLKQHTPIIHFQHYLEGATLRATEVKPLLDKFLIEKFSEKNVLGWEQWLIPQSEANKTIKALAYKLRFKAEGTCSSSEPCAPFFGNMGVEESKDEERKKFMFNKQIYGEIHSMHTGLVKLIKSESLLTTFFVRNNFGTRKNKGFGSYLIEDSDNESELDTYFEYYFDIDAPNRDILNRNTSRLLFEHIDLFYRVIRGGLNVKGSGGVAEIYVKSTLFSYFKSLHTPIQWEKRVIKHKFFLKKGTYMSGDIQINALKLGETLSGSSLESHKQKHETLYYNIAPFNLVRDLLGFSPEEQWQSYANATIKKNEVELDTKGGWKNKEDAVERWASPIYFKPVYTDDNRSCRVYIRLKEDNKMLSMDFEIKTEGETLIIRTPESFSLLDYFDFLTNNKRFLPTIQNANFIIGKQTNPKAEKIMNVFNSLTKLY
jgi:hypothetical protein